MASAVDKQPAAARLAAVAAAGYLPTATNESQSSYTTCGDTTCQWARPSPGSPLPPAKRNRGASRAGERCRAECNEVVVEVVALGDDEGGGDARPRAAPGEAHRRLLSFRVVCRAR